MSLWRDEEVEGRVKSTSGIRAEERVSQADLNLSGVVNRTIPANSHGGRF